MVKRIGECRDIEKETAEHTGARRTSVESMHTALTNIYGGRWEIGFVGGLQVVCIVSWVWSGG